MLHLDDGAGAQPHELLRRLLKANANGKALGDPHPIERALDVGDRARQVDAVGVEHAGADALDDAFDRARTVDHRVDGRAIADRDGLEIGLAEVRDREPLVVVDEREQALRRGHHLAAQDREADDAPRMGCLHGRVLEMALGEP